MPKSQFLSRTELENFTLCYSTLGQEHWLRQHQIDHFINANGDVILNRSCLDVVREQGWRKKIFLTKTEVLGCSKMPRRGIGIYFLKRNGAILYVGKTTNFFVRMAAHDKGNIPFDDVTFIPMNESDLDLFEREYILKFDPEYNSHLSKNTRSYKVYSSRNT